MPTVNRCGDIGSDVHLKAERPEMLTVARGLSLSDWGQEIIWRRRLSSSVLVIARKAVIGGAPCGDWYGSHAMDGPGSLR